MASLRSSMIAVFALLGIVSAPVGATINVTVSDAGSASAQISGYDLFVNDLNSAQNGLPFFHFTGSPITGATTDGFVNVYGANVYGGAGGTGSFGSVSGEAALQLSAPVNYFGLWGSALDGNNSVALYNGKTLLGTYALQNVLQSAPNYSSAYYGNPFGGGDSNEQFAFFNFASDTGFDRVDLIQNGGGGFELDNITVGTLATGPVSAAPEPATWAMMLAGFGMLGAVLRLGHHATRREVSRGRRRRRRTRASSFQRSAGRRMIPLRGISL